MTEIHMVVGDERAAFLELLREYFASIAPEVGEHDAGAAVNGFLKRPRCYAWVAYVDGVPAATVSSREIRDDACELKHLYVRPEFRGRQLSRALVETVHERAIRDGFTQVYLDTLPSMVAAQRLYASCGYEPCERYDSEALACKIFMRKALRHAPEARLRT